jgi:hypothetical protein
MLGIIIRNYLSMVHPWHTATHMQFWGGVFLYSIVKNAQNLTFVRKLRHDLNRICPLEMRLVKVRARHICAQKLDFMHFWHILCAISCVVYGRGVAMQCCQRYS